MQPTVKSSSELSQWFFELYKVASATRRTPTKNPMYTLLGPDGKLISRQFLRQDLMKIDAKKLTKELGYPEPEWVLEQKSFADAIKKFEQQPKKKTRAHLFLAL
eukprot:TRINITY_DN870_c0_g1_i16.p1 TRINITY_DN870_c0_g1~~TRINITY_DN870_c0_g1_i16.p1  ORF type:complete len:104 (-),score=14.81 TRINITY_DN870_c0_g1_i16:22-333(-)